MKFRLSLAVPVCFFICASGTVAYGTEISSVTKLYPAAPESAILPVPSRVYSAQYDGESGRVVTEFLQLYHQRRNNTGTPAQTLLPRPAGERKNLHFASVDEPITLTSKRAIQPGLMIKMNPLGTPGFIAGVKGQVLQRSDTGKFGLTQDKQSIEKQVAGFLKKFATTLKLTDPVNELQLVKISEDATTDQFHARYAQKWQGIPVWGAELIVHANKQGDIVSMAGKHIPSPTNLPGSPAIDAERAIDIAKAELLGKSERAAEINSWLVIYSDERNPQPVLAWEITLNVALDKQLIALIDAQKSSFILGYNNIKSENVSGQGADVNGSPRPLNVWRQGNEYSLHDTSKPMYDGTSDPLNPDQAVGVIHVLDARNKPENFDPAVDTALPPVYRVISTSATSGWLPEAVGAAYGLSETYDYYYEKHGRNSLDGKGGNITAVVRLADNFFNAFWYGGIDTMFFGDGDKFSTSLDIVGHELTHGVTEKESNLVYQGQPGALNEAMSDIFGEAVEHRTFGQTDWQTGSGLRDQEFNRSLKDPGSFSHPSLGRPYPSKMSEYVDLPVKPESDNGGVHINSSIINHAFYLLAEGLNNAIGMDDAAKIFYRANTVHLLPRSQFKDARRACIQSAEEIFGANSAQSQATAAAFDAVEIFDSPTQPTPSPGTPANSEDAIIMLFEQDGNVYPGRYEAALGDKLPEGSFLSGTVVQSQRPAVTSNGSVAAFVSADYDLCLINTDGADESCIGRPGEVHAIAFSPDGDFFSLILRDPGTGEPKPSVIVSDLDGNSNEYSLQAAQIDDAQLNTVIHADAMDFSADNRYLVYDALNRLTLNDGQTVDLWSIYAIDLNSQNTITIVPPLPGASIGNPNLSNINRDLVTFDIFNTETKINTVAVANFATGELNSVTMTSTYAVPAFTGDDSKLVYSVEDQTATGYSLHRIPVSGGTSTLWISNAYAGAIYRRGAFSLPASVDIETSQMVDRTEIGRNDTVTFSIRIKNNGPDAATDIIVTNNFATALKVVRNTLPTQCTVDRATKVTCRIGTLNAGETRIIALQFSPEQVGKFKNAVDVISKEQDSNLANNTAFAEVNVTEGGGSGGSGGGSVSWLLIVLILLQRFYAGRNGMTSRDVHNGKRGCLIA